MIPFTVYTVFRIIAIFAVMVNFCTLHTDYSNRTSCVRGAMMRALKSSTEGVKDIKSDWTT